MEKSKESERRRNWHETNPADVVATFEESNGRAREGQEIENTLDMAMVAALVRVMVCAEAEAHRCAKGLVMACLAVKHQVDVADRA